MQTRKGERIVLPKENGGCKTGRGHGGSMRNPVDIQKLFSRQEKPKNERTQGVERRKRRRFTRNGQLRHWVEDFFGAF